MFFLLLFVLQGEKRQMQAKPIHLRNYNGQLKS